jgi:hypothetical protein
MANLKGTNAKKIPKKKKEKMEKTLKKMVKVRKDDSIHLREVLASKLKWALEEKIKAIQTINDLKAQLLKIEGAILCLNDILNPEPEEK